MWIVEFVDAAVAEFLAQPKDIQARLERYIVIIESGGINVLHEPHAKHLRGSLWELRLKGKDGIARHLRDTDGTAGAYRQGLYEEDREDTAA